jgi:hypothetical protein
MITKTIFTFVITFSFWVLSNKTFGQVIFTENFEGTLDGATNLPMGWNETGLSDDGIYYVGTDIEANEAGFWPVPAHTNFAQSNDDVCNCDKSEDRLILPVIDLSSYSGALRLIFSTVADNQYGGAHFVEVSTDGGASWTSVYTIPTTTGTTTWQDLEVSLSAYLGLPNVLISFLYDDQGQWGNGLAIDDVSLVVVAPVNDLGLGLSTNPSEYTIVPQTQFTSLNALSVNVTNFGDLSVSSYTVNSAVYLAPDFTTPIQTFNTNGGTLSSGQTANLAIGSYNPSALGTYLFQHIVSISGDANQNNDTVSSFFTLSQSEYARDLGNLSGGGLGIGLGTELILGQTFTITTTIALDSVLFLIAPQVAGGNVSVQVATTNAGVPDPANYIGSSADVPIDAALVADVVTNGFKVLKLPITATSSGPLILNPGTYFIGVKQDVLASNMGLQNSNGIITTNTNFFNTNGGAYAEVSTVLPERTPFIRAFLNQANLPPVAVNDVINTDQDQAATINVTTNDSDPENNLNIGSVTITVNPLNGTVSVNSSTGEVTYTPNPGYFGSDSFTYSICDGHTPPACANATVSVTVNIVLVDNDGDGYTNDVDCDDNNPSVNPGATEIPDNGLDDDCVGGDLITVNQSPIAVNDFATTPMDTPVNIFILANDSDPEDGAILPANALVIIQPTNGTAFYDNVSGTLTYTPNTGFVGTDVLTYAIVDSQNAFAQATVTINVTGSGNQAPIANDDIASTLTNQPVIINVTANDSDPDGTLNLGSVTIVTGPTNGSVTINTSTGAITYTPNPGYTGTDVFTYSICDNATPPLCDDATVTINVTGSSNQAPIANNDAASTTENQPVVINVTANDSDPDGTLNLSSITITSGPTNGTVTINTTTGAITYTPNPGYAGNDVFTYSICDNATPPLCDNATVTITITSSNNVAPIANDDNTTILINTSGTIAILLNDTDINGNPAIWSGHTVDIDVTQPGIQHTFNTTSPAASFSYDDEFFGTVSCTPATGVTGIITIVYELCDSQNLCDQANVTFNVVFNTASMVEEDFTFSVYPNPTRSYFMLESSVELKSYRLTNLAGQEMNLPQVEQSKFDVSELAKGVYYLTLAFENGSLKTIPLVIE